MRWKAQAPPTGGRTSDHAYLPSRKQQSPPSHIASYGNLNPDNNNSNNRNNSNSNNNNNNSNSNSSNNSNNKTP